MNKTQYLLASLLACLMISPAWAAPEGAINISERMECLRANLPTSIGVRKVTLTTTDTTGATRSLIGRLYAIQEPSDSGRNLLRATLRIDEPPNLAGAAYLVRETEDYLRDGMFVYLPAVGRVRRISGSVTDRSLMGSGFSYFDFKQITNAFGDLSPELVAVDTIGDRPTHIFSFTPLEGAETRYTKVHAWIDEQSCLLIRADFREGDKVIKRLTAPPGSVVKTGNKWVITMLKMDDLQTGTHSELIFDEVTLDEELSAQRFNPKSFYLTQ